eukprot:TRINITY_DN1264_c0_g1_i7.p1 TRINITY_DN1264_c0_g1~~TRINITY_DN1264_c0_g1_i7.p1  ORF type:complete len:151 (-),score=5.69 TRINITY_DN1264_c0_g1_i7:1043-1495(-)
MMKPIFCGNFEYDARQSDLERLFSRYGKVDRVDMKSGECLCFSVFFFFQCTIGCIHVLFCTRLLYRHLTSIFFGHLCLPAFLLLIDLKLLFLEVILGRFKWTAVTDFLSYVFRDILCYDAEDCLCISLIYKFIICMFLHTIEKWSWIQQD